jgi:hypothetical protein
MNKLLYKYKAIIYDYLETSHTIHQKKGTSSKPKIINIAMNNIDIT